MASQGMSRKRPAPGANPTPYPQQVQQPAMFNTNAVPQLSDDQFLQWGQSAQEPSAYQDASVYGTNSNNYNANNQSPSNQLTRRPPMSQVVTRPRFDGPSTQPWAEEPNSATVSAWADDIQELERKAQVAKKDAQAKRKQIPPFVQKLNR
jgi:heat shock transcription factor, other eukaryote